MFSFATGFCLRFIHQAPANGLQFEFVLKGIFLAVPFLAIPAYPVTCGTLCVSAPRLP